MVLTDNETKVDLLNSEVIAQTIVNLIRERPKHPITVGVHGDWGAGKSSVLEMIEALVEKDKEKVLCIKFNGWRFQGFEDAKIALIEGIVTELVEKRSLFTKAKDEVNDVFERIDWLKAAKKTGGFLLTALTGIPSGEVVSTFLGGLQNLVKNPAQYATKENAEALFNQGSSLLKPKNANKNIPKEISEFRKSFDKLLKKAEVEQLIILVDDLDRCLPDTAIETLEAMRLFIFTERTAFVIAADEGMIEYAVKKHFPELPESTVQQTYTRNYLEKLIQIPFRIPILGELETRIYITLLMVGSEIGDEAPEFNLLVNEARNRLKKPWESKPLDSETIRLLLGDKASKAQNALLISDQIGPILTAGTKGNPRQIKRFLNTLILRHRTAEARGFKQLVEIPILAKLLIAERFLPRLFEQIGGLSAASPTGASKEISILEEDIKLKDEKASGETLKPSKKKDDKNLEVKDEIKPDEAIKNEWLSSQDIRTWAQIEPPLASVDLRPYLFIAKDKKDFFGTSSSLGHLASIVEKLFGKKLAVQSLVPEIKRFSPLEANQVFDALRTRIINNAKFDVEPDGIQGLISLVKTHQQLQTNLVDLLEGLPKEKVGVWALKGWEGVIENEAQIRLDKLVDIWATDGNTVMKFAAQNVKKMRTQR